MTAVYLSPGDGSDHLIEMTPIGSRMYFTDRDSETNTNTLWTTDGTQAGTAKLASFDGLPMISPVAQPVAADGTVYFTLASGPWDPNIEASDSDVVGYIGAGRKRLVNVAGVSTLELWRSDGTPASTGRVRTLWRGDADGKIILATPSVANGKLLVRTAVWSGVPDHSGVFPDELQFTPVSDETTAFDPHELEFGRNGATARLINGVLRVGGSIGDDQIQVWRSSRNPDRLIVHYKQNERSFPFSSLRLMVIDVQGGNDRFEILEGASGAIRARTSIFGGDGTDTIITGGGQDTILGGGGGDAIFSRGGADIISGGAGRDRINSGGGEDQIAGGSGQDQILAGFGVDVLIGQNAVESAFGTDVEGENVADDVLIT